MAVVATPVAPDRPAPTSDGWDHVRPDRDGSLAFHSEDEAKRYAEQFNIALAYTRGVSETKQPLTHDNLVKLGVVWCIIDPSILNDVPETPAESDTVWTTGPETPVWNAADNA